MAPAARPQAPDAGATALARSGLPDGVSWWGEPGRPGWLPEAWLGTACPASLAGLVVGGWRLEEPDRAPGALPWPGVVPARSPLAWYDSLEVSADGGAAWAGFDGALAELRGTAVPGGRRARSTFALANGSHALDEYSLTLARGDTLKDAGVDVMSGTRGAGGGFEAAGRHLWGVRSRVRRGGQRIEASFAQRGAAGRLEGGEEEAASGRSGTVAWSLRRGDLGYRLGFTRGLDRHESFGGLLGFSAREAQETRLTAETERVRGERELAVRVQWSDAAVTRFSSGAFARQARSLWGAMRGVMPVAGGRLEVAVGLGRHDGVKRLEAVPSAAFSARRHGVDATVSLDRLVAPVWTDLAPGVEPFLQRAWVATVKAATVDSQAWHVRGSLRGGRVYSRALADRLPLEELWLRSGLRPEYGTYDFALIEGGLEWEDRHADAGVEGFGLAHRSTVLPAGVARGPRADPDVGFRAWAGGRTMLFGGDLGVGVRVLAEGVGAREADFGGLRRLPAFVTFSLEGNLVLGDATVGIRARNLEDRARELPWWDSSTGLPATAGSRDLRITLVWRLFN